MKVAVFDAHSGVSGDMTLGAFLDAGLPFSYLKSELQKLRVRGYKLKLREVSRNTFRAKKIDVAVSHEDSHSRAHWQEIKRLIMKSRVHSVSKKNALKIFTALAEAEAKVHGIPVSRVHFHEAGAIDSIVDIVGCGIALNHFNIQKIFVSRLCVGQGFVRSEHGLLPIPAPAASELLRGFQIERCRIKHEMITPTGAAIIKAFAVSSSELPPMEVETIGWGAGDAEFKDRANILRISIGTVTSNWRQERILALQTNIDDMLPLAFEPLSKKLFEQGALDVFVEPVFMKKQRPAYLLTVLCPSEEKRKFEEILFHETPTLGIRTTELSRVIKGRRSVKIKTRLGTARVKYGFLPSGKTLTVSPEYRDVLRLAERKSLPFTRVYETFKDAAQRANRLKI